MFRLHHYITGVRLFLSHRLQPIRKIAHSNSNPLVVARPGSKLSTTTTSLFWWHGACQKSVYFCLCLPTVQVHKWILAWSCAEALYHMYHLYVILYPKVHITLARIYDVWRWGPLSVKLSSFSMSRSLATANQPSCSGGCSSYWEREQE